MDSYFLRKIEDWIRELDMSIYDSAQDNQKAEKMAVTLFLKSKLFKLRAETSELFRGGTVNGRI